MRPSRLSAFLLLPLGANAVGFTVQLLAAFTVLAILFLGESFAAFRAAGIATILAGVILATRAVSHPRNG